MKHYFLLVVLLMNFVHLSYQELINCPENHVLWHFICIPIITPSICGPGFNYVNQTCVPQSCPAGQIMTNGMCYPQFPIYPTSSPLTCPNGYSFYNSICYNTSLLPTTAPTITSAPTTTTATTSAPPGCPPDSVLIDGECRLKYCSQGTLHQGRCLEPVCIDGLVWNGNACVEPHVITTILKIEKEIITVANQTGPIMHEPEVNNTVIYHKPTEKTDGTIPSPITPSTNETSQCCIILSPRLCKRIRLKWYCVNRHYKRCDDVCGNHKSIILRVPQVIDHPSHLVIPPNPPLDDCSTKNCTSTEIDCSGCSTGHRAKCSSYCYYYHCRWDSCTFIDQREYCTTYPQSVGCSNDDGCYDEWCNRK